MMNVSLRPALTILRQEIQQGINQAEQGEFSNRTIADLKVT